ncbi:MAG: thiamine pyrophosphate-binding protein [Candidatus Bathyarchaeota archaeon]|nr:thiamine pyrophosphate-binding protein [Candidatus Bathyarchaeota archaeon]
MKNVKIEKTQASPRESTIRTGGEWFLKTLQALGVEYVFGTTGGAMPDIQDAMTEVKPPIWIQSLHEFPTVVAAMGYALASERPGICLIDRIVGTANAMGAFYAAYENYAPIVIFASQNLPALTSGHASDGSPRRHGAHYHSWQSILTTPWTKWRYELSNPDMLASSVLKAVSVAMNEPSGPVYMTLRQDLMASRLEATPIPPAHDVPLQSKTVADGKSIEVAAKLVAEADNPIIWATNMGRHVAAVPRLMELAETLGCGVLDGRNFLNVPMEHPLFLGFNTYRRMNAFVQEADVLVNVENYYEPPIEPPAGCDVVDIYTDPAMLQGGSGGDYGGTYYVARSRLVGDSTATLTNLISAVRKALTRHGSKEAIQDRYQKTRTRHEELLLTWAEEAEKYLNEDPISPHRIAYELNKLWDDHTIWVNQTITMRQALMQGIQVNRAGTFFTNPSGHLGATAGAAYGVALARPREKVVAMMGDGDFIFGNPPAVLWSCSHYHIPVLYLIFNNQCWGIEWPFIVNATLGLAAKQKDYQHVDLVEPKIGFQGLAESMGVHAKTLKHPSKAAETLQWGLEWVAQGEPALIDIHLKKYTEGPSSYSFRFNRPAL